MMSLLRRPPKEFEELIRGHFWRCGSYIPRACDAYKKGYLIGSLSKDASISDKSEANSNSVGFKTALANKILPKLIPALRKVGVDCHDSCTWSSHSGNISERANFSKFKSVCV
ncbi:hypothetical protein NE237_017177 [Protea cynaroides]|uniref:Uncharacterized protein n=1 Tax=Protea cynaroides TaxID=273540 RepID=A0A9Q0K7J0_9MAGN|nr:hypothetical protein NE237_017177 [Protea cynaroides]